MHCLREALCSCILPDKGSARTGCTVHGSPGACSWFRNPTGMLMGGTIGATIPVAGVESAAKTTARSHSRPLSHTGWDPEPNSLQTIHTLRAHITTFPSFQLPPQHLLTCRLAGYWPTVPAPYSLQAHPPGVSTPVAACLDSWLYSTATAMRATTHWPR
jgi:hypothetical protein